MYDDAKWWPSKSDLCSKRRIIGKIQKTFFPGEVIFGGQNQKKNFKNFIVPKCLLGHIDHLYTYKGHLSMLATRKNAKKKAILSQNKDKIATSATLRPRSFLER